MRFQWTQKVVLVLLAVTGAGSSCTCLQGGLQDPEGSSSSGTGSPLSSSFFLANSSNGQGSSSAAVSSSAGGESSSGVVVSSSGGGASSSAAETSSSATQTSSSQMLGPDDLAEVGTAPSCAIAGDGSAIVSWLFREGGNLQSVRAASYSTTTQWTTETTPLTGAVADLFMPNVAMDTAGNGIVSFSLDEDFLRGYLVHRPAGGAFAARVVAAPDAVRATTVGRPVMLGSNGSALVPMKVEQADRYSAELLTLGAGGTAGMRELLGTAGMMDNAANPPVLAVHSSGHAVAAFRMATATATGLLHVATRTPAGVWSTPEVFEDATTTTVASVAINATGEAVVVYTVGNMLEAFVRVRPAGGMWSAPESRGEFRRFAFAAISDAGEAVVVVDERTNMSPSGMGRRYMFSTHPSGGAWTALTQFALDDPTESTTPLAAMDALPDGRLVLAFASTQGGMRQLSLIKYSPAGGWAAPTLVGPTAFGIYFPCVSWRGGAAVVAWQDDDSNNDGTVRATIIP